MCIYMYIYIYIYICIYIYKDDLHWEKGEVLLKGPGKLNNNINNKVKQTKHHGAGHGVVCLLLIVVFTCWLMLA